MSPSPAAILRKIRRICNWKAAGASKLLLNFITIGLVLKPAGAIPALIFENQESVLSREPFIRTEIGRWVASGQLRVVDDAFAAMIHPIGVVDKKGGKLRLIIDTRLLNAFLPHIPFVMDTLRDKIPLTVEAGDFMCSFDLEDAYLNVPISDESQKYLCFRFEGRTFAFTCLPFGLSLSPIVFTKTAGIIASVCRRAGLKVVAYIDDFLISSRVDYARPHAEFAKWLLGFLYFKPKEDKCLWSPTQNIEFLGMILDSVSRKFLVPRKKLCIFRKVVGEALHRHSDHGRVPLKLLEKIRGSLEFFALAMEPASYMNKNIQHVIARSRSQEFVSVPEAALADLRYWAEDSVYEDSNGRSFISRFDLDFMSPPIILEVDASDSGWGCIVRLPSSNLEYSLFGEQSIRDPEVHSPYVGEGLATSAGVLAYDELATSSTMRELLGLRYAISDPRIQKFLTGKRTLIRMDNAGAIANLRKGGGPNPGLSDVTRSILITLRDLLTSASFMWIPRELNLIADGLSKREEFTSICLTQESADYLFRRFRRCTVDRFASKANHVLPKWVSRVPEPGAWGVDAFREPHLWLEAVNFIHPHPDDLPKVASVLKWVSARCLVLAPWWPGSSWFNEIRSLPDCSLTRLNNSLLGFRPRVRTPVPLPKWDFAVFVVN